MLFHTPSFLLFIVVVFALHWGMVKGTVRWQNALLLVCSYFFYACWDWRFVGLLLFSTVLDFVGGILISGSNREGFRRAWMIACMVINLALLGVFKYYDFFADSFSNMLNLLGVRVDVVLLNLILPVGISFYTFHGLSYVIDIYYRRIQPERQWVDYALFVSYFPLLVAGPIERAGHLLPQLKTKRIFSYPLAVMGLRLILWGLFKKVVIADSCAAYVDLVYANPADFSGSSLLFAAILFSFQIYGDFSGYSDIATGVSKLFGIDLLRNFRTPYFASSVTEFWKRWHISLSSWFKDYLYKPLGGSRVNKLLTVRNLAIVFLVSGLWHGASLTFLVWGGLHALFVIAERFIAAGRYARPVDSDELSFSSVFRILVTFFGVTFLWIFFRADNMQVARLYFSAFCDRSLLSLPSWEDFSTMAVHPAVLLLLLLAFMVAEWKSRNQEYTLAFLDHCPSRALRFATYYTIIGLIFIIPVKSENFIYFQF